MAVGLLETVWRTNGELAVNGKAYLVDSVIFIDHFNGISEATDFLREHRAAIYVSLISRAEVLTGFPPVRRREPMLLLDQLRTLSMDRGTADLAADLRRTHRWRLPDAFQAALATQHALKLVTRNTKDFDPKKHRFVLVPYVISNAGQSR